MTYKYFWKRICFYKQTLYKLSALKPSSYLRCCPVKTNGYFSKAMEPSVGGGALDRISLANNSRTSCLFTESSVQKIRSTYTSKLGKNNYRNIHTVDPSELHLNRHKVILKTLYQQNHTCSNCFMSNISSENDKMRSLSIPLVKTWEWPERKWDHRENRISDRHTNVCAGQN